MSVASATGKVQYTLTSGNPTLAIPFYFLENSHVRVIRTRSGVDTVLSSGFSLSGAGVAAGGSCVLDGTQTQTGDRITIKRNVPLTQLVSYVENDRFPAATHERAMDRLTMIAQMVKEISERALVYGEGEVVGAENMLPKLTDRANKRLGFDANGRVSMEDPLPVTVATGDVIEISNYSALRAVVVSGLTTGRQARVSGYSSSSDGAGGLFTYDSASAAADDNGTVLAPAVGSGRWLRNYTGAVNVRWFGAKGDGVTEDTTPITAAIATGKPVFFPAGTYLVGSQLTLSTNGQTLFGESANLSRIKASAAIQLFYGTGLSHVTIRDLALEGGHTGYLGTALSGVRLDNSHHTRIMNNTISKFEIGVFIRSPAGADSLSPLVQGNVIHDCYARGVSFFGTGNSSDPARGVKNLRCVHNYVYNIGVGGVGSYAGSINTKECRGGVIANNTVHNGDAIRIENSDEIVIANNTVSFMEKHGIIIYNHCRRCVVSNNTVFTVNMLNTTNGVNTFTPALSNADLAGTGIHVEYVSHDNIIIGNLVIDDIGGTGYMHFGIWINPTNMPDDGTGPKQNIVIGNTVLGAITSHIEDRGYRTVKANNVTSTAI